MPKRALIGPCFRHATTLAPSRRRLCGGVTLSAGNHHNGSTEHQRSEPLADHSLSVTAGAAAATVLSQNDTPQQPLSTASTDVSRQFNQFKQFIPKVGLFFLLAFVNTILDSLKDTLVITAHGGGTQVIPYLTVYAVLPSSILFLFLYSFATQRLARGQLFSIIVTAFVSFFVTFAMVLYPNHEALHLHALADSMSQVGDIHFDRELHLMGRIEAHGLLKYRERRDLKQVRASCSEHTPQGPFDVTGVKINIACSR